MWRSTPSHGACPDNAYAAGWRTRDVADSDEPEMASTSGVRDRMDLLGKKHTIIGSWKEYSDCLLPWNLSTLFSSFSYVGRITCFPVEADNRVCNVVTFQSVGTNALLS